MSFAEFLAKRATLALNDQLKFTINSIPQPHDPDYSKYLSSIQDLIASGADIKLLQSENPLENNPNFAVILKEAGDFLKLAPQVIAQPATKAMHAQVIKDLQQILKTQQPAWYAATTATAQLEIAPQATH